MRPRDKRRQRSQDEARKMISLIGQNRVAINSVIQCGLGDWAEGAVLLSMLGRRPFLAVEPIHRYCMDAWQEGFRGTIIQGLLWNETGLTKELHDYRTRTSVHDTQPHGLGAFSVRTVTLDDAVDWTCFPATNALLWMDCEGSELEILKGATATLKDVSAIICELKRGPRHEAWPEADVVIGTLDSLGYELVGSVRSDGVFLRKNRIKDAAQG